MSAAPAWLAQRERGSAWLMRLMALVALRCGRTAGRALLYPICGYFVLFSRTARTASIDYLARARGRPPGFADVFKHYHRFAQTILDRVFLLAGRTEDFHFDVDGVEELAAAMSGGRGCLLFGAHFGSFEVLRALAAMRSTARVRVLMHEENSRKINGMLRMLNRDAASDVITLGRPQTMLEVRDAVESGQVVGLLADRAVKGDRLVVCDFLGTQATFPQGPFILAAVLGVPVVLFSAVCCSDGRYRVRFERFATESAAREPAAIAAQCQRYASWLEAKCRADPYNWFNFYDFFATTRAS